RRAGHARHRRRRGRPGRRGARHPDVHRLFAAAQGAPRARGRGAPAVEGGRRAMSRERQLPPEVDALLDHEREIQPLPASVRARPLARARAALVAGSATRLATPTPVPRTRWAAVAVLICIGGATVGAAAYQFRAHLAPAPEIRPIAAPVKTMATT